MIKFGGQCRRLLRAWVHRNQCICRIVSALSEGGRPSNRQLEPQTTLSQKCSVQNGVASKPCSVIVFDDCNPGAGVQSSVTKFRFEVNCPVEVCEEWLYTVRCLKSAMTDVEESLNSLKKTSAEDLDSLHWFARPYHYTADDIIDRRHLQLPDVSTYSRTTGYSAVFSETSARLSQKYDHKSNAGNDISAGSFPSAVASNTECSLDVFFAYMTSVCNVVQFNGNYGVVSRDFLQDGGPTELLPYLDAKTFYVQLLSGLDRSESSYVLHCDDVSRRLLLVSSDLLQSEHSSDPRLLSAGTSSDLTPEGNGDKQKLPNIDQLRAIQDNLAYNMPKLFTSAHDYNIYTKDLVFENRWFPGSTCTTKGQMMYSLEIARLKLFIHLRLANTRVQVLKTTAHPEDGTVRVRWRVVGIPVTHAVKFWKFLPWTKRATGDNTEWMDGFSTFYVGDDGLVYKHTMDRIIPDDGVEVTTKKGVIEKLVGITSPAATT